MIIRNLKDDKNGSRYRYLILASHQSPLKRVVIYHYKGNDVFLVKMGPDTNIDTLDIF